MKSIKRKIPPLEYERGNCVGPTKEQCLADLLYYEFQAFGAKYVDGFCGNNYDISVGVVTWQPKQIVVMPD